jgi:hypothetical protein
MTSNTTRDWSQPPPGWKASANDAPVSIAKNSVSDKNWSQPPAGWSAPITPPQSVMNQLGNAAQNYINTPMEQTLQDAKDMAAGLTQGIANIAPGAANLGIHAYNGLTGNDAKPYQGFDYAPHNVNATAGEIESYLGPTGLEKLITKTPELAGLASKAGKAVESLLEHPAIANNKTLSAVKNSLSSTAVKNIASGATQGALYNPNNQAAGAGGGALIGAVLPSSVYETLGRVFRGGLSPEQLKTNLESAQGTNTGLGRVINSPMLNRTYENVLPHVIGSNAEHTMQDTANVITEKGNKLLENIRGDTEPGNYGIQLQEALQKASKEASQEKTESYNVLNKAADDAGLNIGRENFSGTAHNLLDKMKSSSELSAENDSELISDLERYASNKEGNNLENTNKFRGIIGDKANQAYIAGDTHKYGIYKQLKDSLSSDISNAFEKSPNPKLKTMYAQTQKDFAEKYAPFEDKDIVKFTKQGGDPDLLLNHFLRGGQNDRARMMSKLTTKLPDNIKNLPAYAYLSKAIDDETENVNPIKLNSLYQKLGKNQKNVLFQDKDVKNQLDKYSNLVNQNKESFNLMYNPKTGARNTGTDVKDLGFKVGQVIAGTHFAGLPGFLATTAGSALLGKAGTKFLTSPHVREKIVNAMLKQNK